MSHAILQGAENIVSLHVVNGAVSILETSAEPGNLLGSEMLRSVLCLEARDLNHAIAIVTECSEFCGGRVEIRAARDIQSKI